MSLDNTATPLPDSVQVTQTAPVEQPAQHVITPETPAAPSKPKDMADTIRDKLREMNKPAEAPRGPDGKFAKTGDLAGAAVAEPAQPAEEPAVPEETPEVAAAPEQEPPAEETPAPAVDPRLEKAPSSWRKEAQAKWAETPIEVREESLRREADFHKGLETYKGWADVGQKLDSEIRPYEAMIRAAGTTPQAIIKDVFNTIYQLKTGSVEQKAAVALNILSEYGVDLEAVQAAQERISAGQPAVLQDPRVPQLEQQVNELRQQQEQRAQAAAQQEFASIVQETEAFKKAPGHEHFEAVRVHMAALMESGVCSTMQEAYDQAIHANPQVRALLEAERQKAERKRAAERAAAARKAASVNVTPRGTLPTATPVGTMDDTLRTKLREINSRNG